MKLDAQKLGTFENRTSCVYGYQGMVCNLENMSGFQMVH
jgi:hypothetical protein